ncbi:conserved hypothetical protein [Desulfamplus magnetovallimortis]|uniref:HD-GYP domain-containing protein n=1 Tax=Desulfamplus magnetovallimortis TaxID=1246637 RepID=A0A1W1HGM1_9BACT|nr:HD domain-containing phosphohydrolase [Desulfamplus magnetovallimortis]SLM31545.1 conserved hypothetical protein [Desulfamplus magnetovallimortis]
MIESKINIDDLIEIVRNGGKVKTGIDVYNDSGVLLLERDIVVSQVKTLEIIKAQGVRTLPLNPENYGGIWDADGNYLKLDHPSSQTPSEQDSSRNSGASDRRLLNDSAVNSSDSPANGAKASDAAAAGVSHPGELERRLKEISSFKKVAAEKYDTAKSQAGKVMDDIRKTGGRFEYDDVQKSVSDLVALCKRSENPFAYLSRDLFKYDDYLLSHCVNVCAIGCAILYRFNTSFSNVVNRHIATAFPANPSSSVSSMLPASDDLPYRCYLKDDIEDIAMGFFLHDIGKVLIPEAVLYKKGRLTAMEFDMIRRHSYVMGAAIIEKNGLKNTVIKNIVKYHHAALFTGEKRCYPGEITPAEIPLYVKMCKLADIYDAMISKQCYKEAYNPIGAVTDIFRKYAGKDNMLQFILHAFVKSTGIYPTGSIIYLMNGQMAYVLEGRGPLVLPFTDSKGNTLDHAVSPVDLGESSLDSSLRPDTFRTIQNPVDVYDQLPSYLKPGAQPLP